jgi:hypothetical protein
MMSFEALLAVHKRQVFWSAALNSLRRRKKSKE